MALQEVGIKLILEGSGGFFGELNNANQAVDRFADQAGRGAERASSGFSSLEQIAIGGLRRIGEAAINAAAQAGMAFVGFAQQSVSAAGEFEASMNGFTAAAGDMGQEEVQEFKDLFLSLGQELPVSTNEVVQAAQALVKGGLDPAIVKAGGLRESLLFAAAAEMSLVDAAELGVKMLGTFGDANATAAEQAQFLAGAQNVMVQTANASTVNVDQLGDAMLAAAGQAKALGLSHEEFTVTLGAIVGQFGSANEAGTSYKNFLSRLVPATKPAREALLDLGLITENGFNKFFDLQGNFLGVENAAGLLQEALSGLSDQQRMQTLQTIFGNDAMGAANAFMQLGAEGVAAFSAEVANANGITEQAAATQQGFDFAMESLAGTIEVVQLKLGDLLLPILTEATLAGNSLIGALLGDADALAALPGPAQAAVGAISDVVAALMGDQAAMDRLPGTLRTLIEVGMGIPGALESARQTIDSFFNTPLGTALRDGATAVGGYLINDFGPDVAGAFSTTRTKVDEFFNTPLGTELREGAGVVADYFANDFVRDLTNGIGVVEGALNRLAESDFGQRLQRGAGVVAEYMTKQWPGDFNRGLTMVLDFLEPWTSEAGRNWEAGMKAAGIFASYMLDEWPGQFQRGIEKVGQFFEDFKNQLLSIGPDFGTASRSIGTAIIDGIIAGLDAASGGLFSTISGIIRSALGSAEQAADISSPSRLFAEAIGIPISEGIAVGMLEGLPALRDASEEVVKETAAILGNLFDEELAGQLGIIRGEASALDILGELQDEFYKLNAEAAKLEGDVLKGNQQQQVDLLNQIAEVEQQLQQAQQEAAQIGAVDPTAGAEHLATRQRQIKKLVGLERDYANATRYVDRERIRQQIEIEKRAQAVELEQLKRSGERRAQELRDIGVSLADGLMAGIAERGAALAETLEAVLSDALRRARAELGISSPSAVFAAQVGMPIAEGVAMGITSGMPAALGAVRDLATGLVRPAMPVAARAQTINHYHGSPSYNYSPSYGGTPPAPHQDFSVMRSLATGR